MITWFLRIWDVLSGNRRRRLAAQKALFERAEKMERDLLTREWTAATMRLLKARHELIQRGSKVMYQ